MSTVAPEAVDRFELNLKAYLEGVLAAIPVTGKVIVVNEFGTREGRVVVEINAHSDLSTQDMGASQQATVLIRISGQVERVPSATHKAIVSKIRCALFDHRPDVRLLQASQAFFNAMNRVQGVSNNRPYSCLHVWDFYNPSASAGGRDSTADTIIAATARFSPYDWNGESPYGG